MAAFYSTAHWPTILRPTLSRKQYCFYYLSSRNRSTLALTSDRYSVLRGPYSILNDNHIKHFEKILGKNHVLTEQSDLAGPNTDWLNIFRGNSKCLLKARSTDEISAVLAFCNENRLAICTQGGNTGLVGGSVPVFDEIILDTRGMNEVLDFNPITGILTAEAGCILETLDDHVSNHGYMMPHDFGSKGSCCIGGNVATAAGGIRLLRYGSIHAHILGLEAVLPDSKGSILDCMKPLRKDNTGLHLPHLFVGSEGQLGVITKVIMTCVPRPTSVNVSFLACDSFQDACKLLSKAKSQLGEILSSFEFLDAGTMDCVEENLKMKNPLETKAAFYVLIETAGSSEEHDTEKLHKFLENSLESKTVLDGTVAADQNQAKYFWAIRERCAEALVHDGYTYKQDFSLNLKDFYRLVEVTRERLGNLPTRVVAYGHLGDGNLHLNITSPEYSKEISEKLYPFLYEWVSEHGGSISAEHGIGFAKKNYAHLCNSKAAMETMKSVKSLFDPKLILNPYKTLANVIC